TDPQDARLPGATVLVVSPALIGRQSTVTQSDGRYLFPALPSGRYTVTFLLPDFQTVVREGVDVSLATTITVDVRLALAAVREQVVVSGAPPVVDVATTRIGTTLKGDALGSVPGSTDLWGVLTESPGIRMEGFDVGGSHKRQQARYAVFSSKYMGRFITDG